MSLVKLKWITWFTHCNSTLAGREETLFRMQWLPGFQWASPHGKRMSPGSGRLNSISEDPPLPLMPITPPQICLSSWHLTFQELWSKTAVKWNSLACNAFGSSQYIFIYWVSRQFSILIIITACHLIWLLWLRLECQFLGTCTGDLFQRQVWCQVFLTFSAGSSWLASVPGFNW